MADTQNIRPDERIDLAQGLARLGRSSLDFRLSAEDQVPTGARIEGTRGPVMATHIASGTTRVYDPLRWVADLLRDVKDGVF